VTERLYYTDSDILEFHATIVQTGRRGEHFYVALDRSAFYPTSGGQGHDTGRLNGVEVIDVVESEDGDVWHLVAAEPETVGSRVQGVVDKERRLRNRQNHTAQHILSAAFHRLYNYRTMSVHLGEEYGAVELQAETIPEEQLREIEKTANVIIGDNVPVEVMFVDGAQAAGLPLRKEPQREGELRVVRIGEYDYSACGGTHCRTSGGVGLIKIIGVDKMRGRALVKYLAGALAVRDYARRFDVTDVLARSFSCHPADLPGIVGKLQDDAAAVRRELAEAQKELLPIRAEQLSQNPIVCGRYKLVMDKPPGIDAAAGSRLAGMVADRIGGVAALIVDERLVLTAAAGSGLHAGNLIRKLASLTGLKGGGNERAAQLGGVTTDRAAAVQDELRTMLANE
jgi:alanyl-tRNA synthetase